MGILGSLMVLAVTFHGVALHICPCVVHGRLEGCGARPPAPEKRSCCAKGERTGPRFQSAGCCCDDAQVRSAETAAAAPPSSAPFTSFAPAAAAVPATAPLPAFRAIPLLDCRGPAPPPPPDPQAVLRVYRL